MITLTRLFEAEIGRVFPGPADELDREFKAHLTFVFNQAIQALRKTGWTVETLVTVGNLLRRLYTVLQAYKSRKRAVPLGEWIAQLGGIADEVSNAISRPGRSL